MQASSARGRGPHRRCLVPIVLLSAMISGCTASQDIPPWFDSFERLPVHTVRVNGHRIAYLDEGHGAPVVLIHGFGGSMWQWEYQQQALSTRFRVITPDLLGAGLSDKPDIEYRPDELVTFFVSFLDALKIERASLVGNSMGAALAIGMALDHPNRVDRLILVSGFPDRVKDKLASPLLRHALDSWVPIWLVKLGNWVTGRDTTKAILEEIVYDTELLTPTVIERAYYNRKHFGIVSPVLKQVRNLELWENGFAKRLKDVHHPTLILWGAKDRIFSLGVGQDLHQIILGSSFAVIPKAGHIPQWEQPNEVNRLIKEFLTL